MTYSSFTKRHIGIRETELSELLKTVQAPDLDTLIQDTIPSDIRRNTPLNIGAAMTETEALAHAQALSNKNHQFKSYIGLGYHACITPPVILRNVFENPAWYTAYTPYQAEIAQGRLETLLTFQTMICDLTCMDIANASLLDEATAAAEAMLLLHRARSKDDDSRNTFLVDLDIFPQTMSVLQLRAKALGITLRTAPISEETLSEKDVFGVFLQYPSMSGRISDLSHITAMAKKYGVLSAVAADLLALTLIKNPGKSGIDVVIGSSQRFGVPMGFGGPHAAFFATRDDYKRLMPGRIIGLSKDRRGQDAYRMALQTREQHIRRDKATSNICTAQALLAMMATFYAIYHGPEGLKEIANTIHQRTSVAAHYLVQLGYKIINPHFFDTLHIGLPVSANLLQKVCQKHRINIHILTETEALVSLNETTTAEDVTDLLSAFAEAAGRVFLAPNPDQIASAIPSAIPDFAKRQTPFLTHPTFNSYHSETEMMRYLKHLESKDLSLVHSMIALGSCTMKLNSAASMMPVSLPGFAGLHPFIPSDQATGYHEVFTYLRRALADITELHDTSLQPNSGAQGEYAGLMVIRAYLDSIGQAERTIVLIPVSAHGTNPASAALAGLSIVLVKCDDRGNIDLSDLEEKIATYHDKIACLMVTYPSTHGVFETKIRQICTMVHQAGGQVYMDGANMNAQVGLTSPGRIGADVCHLNLHKTFSIPHGGGGPGMGPICVAKHLTPFLPGHPLVETGGVQGIAPVSAAPWGSASILLISYMYIRMLGGEGLTASTKTAILSANYIKDRLAPHYDILYVGEQNHVAHEVIVNVQAFKKTAKIEVEDIAKRLMDYGFHAPTVSFPVPGTMMIEPTESESLSELNRFCDALIQIRHEIRAIETGLSDPIDNVLKQAPHPMYEVVSSEWTHPYSREEAALPGRGDKFWPATARIDGAYGDRNLICTCEPVANYAPAELTPA
jgi:glycine dehydrogenase